MCINMHKNWVQVNLLVILFCIPILSEGKSLLDWPNQDYYRDNAYNNHYWNSQPGYGNSYSSAKANRDDRSFSPTTNKQPIYVPPIGYSKEELSNVLKQYYGLKESIIPKYETKPQDSDRYDSHQMWENPSQLSGNENAEYLNYKNPTTLNSLYESNYGKNFKIPEQYNDYKLIKGTQDELRSYTQNVKGNDYGTETDNYDKSKVVRKMNFDKTGSVKNLGLNDPYPEMLTMHDQNILNGVHSTKLKKYDLENGNKMKAEIVTEAVNDDYDEPIILRDLNKEQYDYAAPVVHKGLSQEQNREALYNYDIVKRVHAIKLKKSALKHENKMKTEIVTEAVDDDYDKPNVLQNLKKEQYGYDDYDTPVVHKNLSQKQKLEDYPETQYNYDIVKRAHSIKLKKSALENGNKMKTDIVTEDVDNDYDKPNVLQDLKKEQYGYDDYDAPVIHKDLNQKQKLEDYPQTQYNYGIFKRVHPIKLKKSALENGNKMKTEIVTEAVDDAYDEPNVLQDLKKEQYMYDYASPVVHKDLSQKQEQEQNREALYNYDIVKRVHSIKIKKSLKNGNKIKTKIVTEAVDDDYDKPNALQNLKKVQYGYDYDDPVVPKDLIQEQKRGENHETKIMAENMNNNQDSKTATMKPKVKNIVKPVKRWKKGSTIKSYVNTELPKKYYDKLFLTEKPNNIHMRDSIFSEDASNKYELPNNYEMAKHDIPVVTNKQKSSNKCSMRKKAHNADCSEIENFDKLDSSENYDLEMKSDYAK